MADHYVDNSFDSGTAHVTVSKHKSGASEVLARAEEAEPRLGDAYQQLWRNWLEGEHDNIRAALTWALESGQIRAGLRTCIAVTRFWEIRGSVPKSIIWFNRFRMKADENVPLNIKVVFGEESR